VNRRPVDLRLPTRANTRGAQTPSGDVGSALVNEAPRRPDPGGSSWRASLGAQSVANRGDPVGSGAPSVAVTSKARWASDPSVVRPSGAPRP
jgi:hypothetical protein